MSVTHDVCQPACSAVLSDSEPAPDTCQRSGNSNASEQAPNAAAAADFASTVAEQVKLAVDRQMELRLQAFQLQVRESTARQLAVRTASSDNDRPCEWGTTRTSGKGPVERTSR